MTWEKSSRANKQKRKRSIENKLDVNVMGIRNKRED